MGFIGTKLAALKQDENLTRLGAGIVMGARGFRAGTGRYLGNKVPVIQWIPAYVPQWMIGDMIAGSSVGMLLLPQAIMYTVVAGLPFQQALLASWLPGLVYAIMGTSKGRNHRPLPSSRLILTRTHQILVPDQR